MKLVCSYCRSSYGEKAPLEDNRISHGMCDGCYTYYQRQLVGLSLDEYLEGFASPVLIVDKDGRIAAANQEAMKVLGKPEREITGLFGGEAMECFYARLPEGCGNTVHCETCTIRHTIMQTMQTGTPMKKAHVTMRREDGKFKMTISSDCVDGMVRVVID